MVSNEEIMRRICDAQMLALRYEQQEADAQMARKGLTSETKEETK